MKKSVILCAGLCVALALTGCKGSESAYKKAYEKAKAQEATNTVVTPTTTDTPVVTPVIEQPVTQTVVQDNSDNTPVRTENVNVVNGAGLKAFSVVVGSYSLKSNAEATQQVLKNAGYNSQIVYNSSTGTYRVIADTFDSKADAARLRDQLSSKYAGAWLLTK
ncbi:MAG: SPOR domain-containing protein [Prevotella sp.]|nr:SPOR domain-containing protein [Prevotella sp.]